MAGRSATIPLREDLGVYARAIDQYLHSRSQKDFAIALLAQRICIEKFLRRKSRYKSISYVTDEINRINTDAGYRRSMAAVNGAAIAQVYPQYAVAQLV